VLTGLRLVAGRQQCYVGGEAAGRLGGARSHQFDPRLRQRFGKPDDQRPVEPAADAAEIADDRKTRRGGEGERGRGGDRENPDRCTVYPAPRFQGSPSWRFLEGVQHLLDAEAAGDEFAGQESGRGDNQIDLGRQRIFAAAHGTAGEPAMELGEMSIAS